MRPDRQVAAEQATKTLATIAAAPGSSPPPLKILRGRDRRARTVRRTDGSLIIELTAHRIQHSSDAGLFGVLAHEYAHAEYDDPETAVPLWRIVVPVLGQIAVLLTGLLAGASVLYRLIGPAGAWIGGVIGLFAAIAAVLIVDAYRRRRRTARAGLDRPWREHRADLRAVQLVGRDPVLAMLNEHPALNRLDQFLHDIAPTHPANELRRIVVERYDPADDPDEAATQLSALSAALNPCRQAPVT